MPPKSRFHLAILLCLFASVYTMASFQNQGGTSQPTTPDAEAIFLQTPTYVSAASGFGLGVTNSIAVADVNGDGRPDLLMANNCNACSNGIGVALGNGDGTFQPRVNYASGGIYPASITAVDVNQDGKLDLLVTNQCADPTCAKGVVSVLLGNGDGTFQSATSYASGGRTALSLAVGDVDLDGKQDIIVGNLDGSIGVLLGNGDGTFRPVVTFSPGVSVPVAVADVNGDGKLDIIAGNSPGNSGVVGVLLGNGNGTFQAAVTYASGGIGVESLAIADVNGDGKLDLLVANGCQNVACVRGNVGVLLGNGNGTFRTVQAFAAAGNGPSSIAVHDVNGDGKPDLIVASLWVDSGFGAVRVLLGDGSGAFHASRDYFAGVLAGAVVVNDVNGDGKPDLLVGINSGVGVLLGNDDGTFQGERLFNPGGVQTRALVAADVNGDGKLDLVATNNCEVFNHCSPSIVSVLLGNGNGTFQAPVSYSLGGSGPESLVVADVNRDGKLDILVTMSPNVLAVLLGNGDGTFQPAQTSVYTSATVLGPLAVADVNGDGNPDLLVQATFNPQVYQSDLLGVMLGNGDGTFQAPKTFSSGGRFLESIAVADVNGDHKPDVVVLNNCHVGDTWPSCQAGEIIGVLLGNGDGTLQPVQTYKLAGGFFGSVTAADMNGDGKPDIIATTGCVSFNSCDASGVGPGGVSVLLGNGNGTFQAAKTIATPLLSETAIALTDFDGDGHLDAILGGGFLLLGNGDGTFQAPLAVGVAGQLAVGDFNGDGLPDVAISEIAILLNKIAQDKLTATTVTASPDPILPNQTATYTATVSGASGSKLTGTLTFMDGDNILGAFPVGGGPVAITETYTQSGVHPIRACYSGDKNNKNGVAMVTEDVVASLPVSTTTKITTSGSPSHVHQAVTFTATVAWKYGSVPNGELVTFYDGTTALTSVPLSNGVARFTTTSLTVGNHFIKATYAGDSDFATSSAHLTQAVVP